MEYWYLFPVGIVIAFCAMSSGISGSSFWTPVYLLWLGLETKVAFWMSLLTMLFGFGSGVYRNVCDRTVNAYLIVRYLLVAGLATAVGAIIAARVRASWLLWIFAAFALVYGVHLLWEYFRQTESSHDESSSRHDRVFWPLGALAGLLQGTVASGAGVLLMPAMLNHRRVHHSAEAVGSAVILVFLCSLISVSFRIDRILFDTLIESRREIIGMVAFAGPGAILGGQLGPRFARRLPRRHLRAWVGVLLVTVGLLIGYRSLG